jgi:cytochrome c553
MIRDRVFSFRDPWFLGATGTVIAIALVAALAGFVWFPSSQEPQGWWQSICTAAGISQPQPPAPLRDEGTSTVVLTSRMLSAPTAVSIGRGATLAHQCAICHGARGPSQVDTPDLAGQFAPAIYKELEDFRSGARVSAVMSPQAAHLTDQDVRDLAAYYAYLPPVATGGSTAAPAIVAEGAPMRNIPPCAACHGGLAVKPGAPRLVGESATYIRAQLLAFADGSRHNDISQQMRNIARQMTKAEIESAAQYYASDLATADRD